MAQQDDPDLERLVQSAIAEAGVESAVIFSAPPGSTALWLVAAAGIDGPALDGLAAAVRNPDHPIGRTLRDETAAYDVKPTAPGGPALRSHLPLVAREGGRQRVNGVLAVAHQHSLDADARRALKGLADTAASLVGRRSRQGADESG